MAIDLLGQEQSKKSGRTEATVIYHQPDKDKAPVKASPQPKVEAPKPRPAPPKEELGEVNLMTSFKAYLFKRRVYIILIALIVILAIGLIIFYLLTRPPQIVNANLNLVLNNTNLLPQALCGNNLIEAGEQCDTAGCGIDQECVNCQCQTLIPPAPVCGNDLVEAGEQCDTTGCGIDQECVNCQCQTINLPPPQPVCGNGIIEAGEQCDTISLMGCTSAQTCINCLCQTVILPDTELAPLRGSLVKFIGSSEVYLVEWHGEIRPLNQQTVYFKSGQTINSLDAKNQIYLINSSFSGIRQGSNVSGYIDWDPRILSDEELQPYK